MSPIEIGLLIAVIAAIGWGLTHRAKVVALTSHVELLHNLLPKIPDAALASANGAPAAAPAPIAAAPLAPTVASPPVALPPVPAPPMTTVRIDVVPPGGPLPPVAPPARNPLSNAPAGFPDTSAGGYPLWYALGGDGKPVGAPVLVYDGNPFASEGEIAAYRVAVAQRNLNLAAYQAPAFVGTVPMSTLTLADWCYVDALGSVNWNAVLAGDADVFRAKTTEAFYNGLAAFDPATYAGPLKQG